MLERYLYAVRKFGLRTAKAIDFSRSPSMALPGGVDMRSGAGAPAYTAAKGSLYSRTDGSGVANRLYINTDGANTWTNVTTAA